MSTLSAETPLIPAVISNLPRNGIREIAALAGHRSDLANLVFGEPDFPTPPHVVEAAAAATRAGATRYGPGGGLPQLREALAVSIAARTGIATAADQVAVTAGGVQAVFGALAALVAAGETVLVPSLAWPSYAGQCALLGHPVATYPLQPESFEPDLERLDAIAATTDAKLLIINTPGNPTGAVWRSEAVEGCVRLAQKHGMWVISDEVYDQMVFDGEHTYAYAYDPERVVTVFSFSKTYAMTGWRVGYARAPQRIVEAMVKVLEQEISCPPTPSQHGAIAALRGDQGYIAQMRDAYRARRDVAVDLLRETELLAAVPRGAFYALADISATTHNTAAFARAMTQRPEGVACAPGEAFGEAGRGLLRLSLAAAPEQIVEGIRRIAAALESQNHQ